MSGAILIISDTFRADHLGCYGADAVATPHLDDLASESAVFTANYAASYPTVPNRLDVLTGRYNFLERGWTSLNHDDVTFPELLGEAGVVSGLVFDTPFLNQYDLSRGFDSWRQIRGHHTDPYSTDPRADDSLPGAPYKFKQLEKTRQYLRNRSHWRHEADFITPRTFTEAIEWLERNHEHEDFLLVVDAWDPHEVFDAPDHYIEQYSDTTADVSDIIYPAYGRPDYLTDAEQERIRARYRAVISMVDAWTGALVAAVDRLGIRDDTLITFTSDHGHLFGEHDLQGKPTGSLGTLYRESTWTPLLLRHPDYPDGAHIEAITQPPDLMPTLLDWFDVAVPDFVDGHSLLPLVAGETSNWPRAYAITARFPESPWKQASVFDGWAGPAEITSPVTITDGRWTLIAHPNHEQSELYEIESDPDQTRDLVDEEEEKAQALRETLVDFLTDRGAESRMVDPFVGGETVTDTLDRNRTIYAFDAPEGRIGHLTEDLARSRSPTGISIERTSFESFAADHPDGIVYINQQYYRSTDLRS